MTVRVNDVEIGEPAIAAELQYHPAGSAEAAWEQAALALVVREVLRQEARRSEIAVADAGETPADDAAIEALLAREIAVPTADEETCRRYYEANRRRFRMQDRYLADHILLAAPPDDREAREAAKIRAAAWIPQIAAEKSAMAELAGRFSDCPRKPVEEAWAGSSAARRCRSSRHSSSVWSPERSAGSRSRADTASM